MLISIPPKYSVSQIMGYLKGKSSLMIFDRHANLKYKKRQNKAKEAVQVRQKNWQGWTASFLFDSSLAQWKFRLAPRFGLRQNACTEHARRPVVLGPIRSISISLCSDIKRTHPADHATFPPVRTRHIRHRRGPDLEPWRMEQPFYQTRSWYLHQLSRKRAPISRRSHAGSAI